MSEQGQFILEGFSASGGTDPASQRCTGIAALLLPGAGNAVPLRQLTAMTGRDERVVRAQIERERRAGALIVSDNVAGYWLADNAADVKRFCQSMRGRAQQIITTSEALERAAGLRW